MFSEKRKPFKWDKSTSRDFVTHLAALRPKTSLITSLTELFYPETHEVDLWQVYLLLHCIHFVTFWILSSSIIDSNYCRQWLNYRTLGVGGWSSIPRLLLALVGWGAIWLLLILQPNLFLLFFSFQNKDNAESAIQDFSSIIRLSPDNPDGWIKRAEVHVF